MRSGVHKPAVSPKIHAATKAAATSTPAQPDQPRIAPISAGRAIRAKHIAKSDLISKFGKSAPNLKLAVVPVKEPHKTVESVAEPKPVSHPAVHHQAAHTPAKAANPFQTAIEQADSHTQPRLKKAKVHHRVAKKLHVSPRLVSFAAVTLMVLGVGGVLAYQNYPELSMRVAATRAGFGASLPSYQPAGFAMAGAIKYAPGEVTLNYKSHTDERSFDVIQKNSGWDSAALLENYVVPTGKPYQTFQSGGRTIYIYDSNKATWVDGGVWYNIDGKTNLSSDQLLRIANSL